MAALAGRSVCIVTPDLAGAVRNGGIGTACAALAMLLASSGCRVTLLFSQVASQARAGDAWIEPYVNAGIEVVVLAEWAAKRTQRFFPGHAGLAMASWVHDWLAEHHFDVIVLMDWQGHGFYALEAKRTGLRFQHSLFVTQLHSPSLWHALNNAELVTDPLQSITYHMERMSVEHADAVLSPSAYMLDWVTRHGFHPPPRSAVLPNLIDLPAGATPRRRMRRPVRELVFFGRLEYRKGLAQFCDALDLLQASGLGPKKVVFLGKFARMGQEHSGLYIARRARSWRFAIEIEARHDKDQAMALLRGAGRLAVMPSVADNSPYAVLECLVAGLPFLARDVGGIGELVHPKDRAECLFDDRPAALADRLAAALRDGVLAPRLGIDLQKNREAWLASFATWAGQARKGPDRPQATTTPQVSVCLTHFNRPHLLRQAVNSLQAQDYQHFEVILVDDGSPGPASRQLLDALEPEFAGRGWRILRVPNGYLGRARNTAARAASGEFLLFMDDDNVARPDMISRLVQSAQASQADLVTCMFEVFAGDAEPTEVTPVLERYLPVGGILSFSVVANAIGDANALMRRSSFEALGGFTQDYGVGHEDFELFARAVLAGVKVAVVPEPLFWYRRQPGSMLSSTQASANRMRSLRPFVDALPAPLAELAVLAHGLACGAEPPSAPCQAGLAALSPADQGLLTTGDPDAPATMLALAKSLVLSGQSGLARQLLAGMRTDQAPHAADPAAALHWMLRGLDAVDASDFDALAGIVTACDGSGLAASERAGVYQAWLASFDLPLVPTGLVVRCAVLLARSAERHVPPLLTSASFLLSAGQRAAAIDVLYRTLGLMDEAYLLERPDVAQAVSAGQFGSGLEHYVRHGRAEGMAWPHEVQVTAVLTALLAAGRQGPPLAVRPEQQLRLTLACRAFVDRGQASGIALAPGRGQEADQRQGRLPR